MYVSTVQSIVGVLRAGTTDSITQCPYQLLSNALDVLVGELLQKVTNTKEDACIVNFAKYLDELTHACANDHAKSTAICECKQFLEYAARTRSCYLDSVALPVLILEND